MKIIHILHPRYHPKIIRHIGKYKQENKCVCIQKIIQLIIMKIKMNMKNGSHRHDINKPRSRHGRKYKKYKKRITMMMLKCAKHYLSKLCISIHEKVKQHCS